MQPRDGIDKECGHCTGAHLRCFLGVGPRTQRRLGSWWPGKSEPPANLAVLRKPKPYARRMAFLLQAHGGSIRHDDGKFREQPGHAVYQAAQGQRLNCRLSMVHRAAYCPDRIRFVKIGLCLQSAPCRHLSQVGHRSSGHAFEGLALEPARGTSP
jgi:hypothetical protein